MHSHHSHSGAFCAHASPDTTPSSMLEVAYNKGFKSYCLSEHVPRSLESNLYPEEIQAGLLPSTLLQRFQEYLLEARKCANAWKGKMNVLVGAELENVDDECINYLQRVLDGTSITLDDNADKVEKGNGPSAGKFKVDYLIGSLHHVDSIPIDFNKETFELALAHFQEVEEMKSFKDNKLIRQRRAHLRLILRYLERQRQLVDYFRPEVIGHFDLCRLFDFDTPMTIKSPQQDSQYADLVEQVDKAVARNIDLVCSYQGLFEVNSASIRKGWSTPYPGEDVLDIILSKGGRLCLSDDAHSHDQIGLNFNETKQYLKSKGVQEIWMLELDDNTTLPQDSTRFPRGTRSVKVSDWTSDSFWDIN